MRLRLDPAHLQFPNHQTCTSRHPTFLPGAECVQNHCHIADLSQRNICHNPSRYAQDVWDEGEIAWPLFVVSTLNEASHWLPTFFAVTLEYQVPFCNFALVVNDGRFT